LSLDAAVFLLSIAQQCRKSGIRSCASSCETGALLQLVGTDALGNVAYSIEVRNIEFDGGVDARLFSSPVPTGWSQVRCARPITTVRPTTR
jgi:hypothetical protein